MEKYIQATFSNVTTAGQELLIAELANIGFDGFEQGPDFLTACIVNDKYDEEAFKNIPITSEYEIKIDVIEQKNWNEEWEKSFQPVIIENFCAIRASFHEEVPNVQYNIIITPKMSFGTGHHATTYQVIKLMEETDFKNKTVLDFGTGTGVLSILAEKLGATRIFAIDNDEWSIDNARENIETNNCSAITLRNASEIPSAEKFDIILANINRHVILENLPSIAKHLHVPGVLILSGLLKDDQQDIVDAAFQHQLFVKTQSQKYDWIALGLTNVKLV